MKSISMAIVFALAMASCNQQEEPLQMDQPQDCVLHAIVEETTNARAGFDSNDKFYWSKGDAIGVTTTESGTNFVKLPLTGAHGKATGTFSGQVSGEISEYAVYPFYSLKHKLNGTNLTYCLPPSYTYSHIDEGVSSAIQGEGNSYNPMMWAKIENGGAHFKHLGGLFIVIIESMPVKAGSLKLYSDMRLTGNFIVDLSAATPQINAVSNGDEYSEVTIKFSGATVGQTGEFYIPVPAGTYPEAIVEVLDEADTQVAFIPFADKVVNFGRMRVLRVKSGSISGGDGEQAAGTLVNGVAKLAEAGTLSTVLGSQLQELTSLKVVGNINADDIVCLKKMLGGAEHAETERGILTSLDLSAATIVAGSGTYGSAGGSSITTTDNIIPNRMFVNCSNLETLILSENIIKIGESAFSGCDKLKSINLPNQLTEICGYTFAYCSSLESIQIPTNVKTIGENAFNASGVINVNIPEGVTVIKSYAFWNSENLTSIVIPNTVEEIGMAAFDGCSNLSNITMSNSITRIEQSTFAGCTSLSQFIIPDKVKVIGPNAFNGAGLTSLVIPEGVEEFSDMADNCAQLKTVTLPSTLTKISCDFYNCPALTEIYTYASEAPLWDGIPSYKIETLYVPNNRKEHYGEKWGNLFNQIIEMTE